MSAPTTQLPFAPVSGTAPTADTHLGDVQIGLDPAGPAATAVVGTVLGSTNSSYGLTQVDYAGTDEAAETTASDVAGRSARTTANPAGGSATENDLYFSINPSVAATSSYDATIDVSYYDSGTGTVALQYDNGYGDPYHTAGTITLTGSDTWKTASFTVTGAYFGGLEETRARTSGSTRSSRSPCTVSACRSPARRFRRRRSSRPRRRSPRPGAARPSRSAPRSPARQNRTRR